MNAYTVSRKIHFQNSRRSKKTIRPGEKPKRKTARTPRISKLMALAIHFEQMLRDGDVEDMATLARYGQVTRARMTQIMNLLLLAPDIQEKLLNLPQTTSGRDSVILRELQALALEPDWTVQQQMWYELYGDIS
jgi:hypothetical protein